jgi:hypothetical protein
MVFLSIDSNYKVELVDDHRFSVKSMWIKCAFTPNVKSLLSENLGGILGGQCWVILTFFVGTLTGFELVFKMKTY